MSKQKLSLKHLTPYIVGIAAFYLVTLSYFYPELVKKETLHQTDVIQFAGMSKAAVDYNKKTGEQALWNDAMFSGLPNYLIATGVPVRGILILKTITRGFIGKETTAHLLFTLMFSFSIMALCFRVKPYLAMFGAIAFALTTFNVMSIEAGHTTKMWAIAYAALVIGGMHLIFSKKYLMGFAIFAMGLALELEPSHFQITFYLIFICIIYAISELVFAVKNKEIPAFAKQSAVILLAIVLASGTSVARIWMTMEYTPYSIRGEAQLKPVEGAKQEIQADGGLDKEYAYSWSEGKWESLTLLIPYFYGGASGEKLSINSNMYEALAASYGAKQAEQIVQSGGIPLYRGDQPFTGGPAYAGAIVCFLFVLAMLILDNRYRWWILGGFVLMMFFAWGRNFSTFNYFLFDYFPGFNKFRTVAMALSLAVLLMPLAGMLALQKLLDSKWNKELQKQFFIAVGATAGVAVLAILLSGIPDYTRYIEQQGQVINVDQSFPQRLGVQDQATANRLIDALHDDRQSVLISDSIRTAILILIVAGLLYFTLQGKVKPQVAIMVTGVIMVGDLWLVGKRYLNSEKFQKNAVQRSHQITEADKAILKDKDMHYRVFSLGQFDREAQTSYYHKSVGGYFAAKMLRYRDLIDRQLFPEQNKMIASLKEGKRPDFSQVPVSNMLNVKYIKFGNEARAVLQNPEAAGNAWFVESVKTVTSPDEEMDALARLNPTKEAVIDASRFEVSATNFQVDSAASIELTKYSPRRLAFKSSNSNPGLAVFSEIYYPKGWEVKIDGNPAELVSVNYVLRGLEVPAGEHEITMEFHPKSFENGATITNISSYLVLLIVIGACGFMVVKEVKGGKEE
ncbi:YfhO family protein [Flammeovirgaceae bacterium SG7u.111]|nr:YfhO family protein [Flammeovirgaceae bacterium SG7u.132]WPO34018.1 YfhO family protein [Flammeovirgaceae bacterium SG7u.111]